MANEEELVDLERQLDFHQKEVNRIVNLMIEKTRLSTHPLLFSSFEDKLKIKINKL